MAKGGILGLIKGAVTFLILAVVMVAAGMGVAHFVHNRKPEIPPLPQAIALTGLDAKALDLSPSEVDRLKECLKANDIYFKGMEIQVARDEPDADLPAPKSGDHGASGDGSRASPPIPPDAPLTFKITLRTAKGPDLEAKMRRTVRRRLVLDVTSFVKEQVGSYSNLLHAIEPVNKTVQKIIDI